MRWLRRSPRRRLRESHFVEPELPDFSKWGKTERVSMRGVRRKTAEHLRQAWNTIPHVTQHDRLTSPKWSSLRARLRRGPKKPAAK